MPDQLQLRGGTTVQHSTFTGVSKEVTVDTTKKTAVVHDGSTVGGNPLLREDASNSALALASAGTPSLKFSGDSNTGVFSPGADQLAITTGGTSRLAVSTTAVSSTLPVDVPLGAVGTPSLTFTGDLNTGIYSPGADQLAISTNGVARLTTSTTAVSSSLAIDVPLGAVGTPSLTFTGDLNTGLFSPGADTVALVTGGTQRATIDSSGRLLVGTSTSESLTGDQYKFQIKGTDASAGLSIHRSQTNNASPYLALAKSRSGAIVSSGDGLGAINFIGHDGVDLDSIAAIIEAQVDGTPGSNDMPGRLVFSTTLDGAASPTERMRIDSAGDMLLGGTTSLARLTIQKAFGGGTAIDTNTTTASTTYNALAFRHNGTIVGYVSASTTATSYNTSSDYRLKENVVSLNGAIDRVNDLQVRRFNFIADPDHTVDGFIAHEAQAVVPECVTGTKDEVDADGNPVYQGIDQSKLVPLLTAALQEAIAKIEALETRLSALEAA